MTLSIAARNAVGSTLAELVNGGYIQIRTGNKPNSPLDTASGTLLATLLFSDPPFGSFNNGVAYANTISISGSILENGVAGWFRIYNSSDAAILDGTITQVGGGGDMTFDTINFLAGGTVIIGNGTISVS